MITPPDGPTPPTENPTDLPTEGHAHRAEPPRYLHVPLLSSDQDPEEVLLRYQLLTERPLLGGLGEVWKVRDQHLNRVVALKKLRTDRAHLPTAQSSFLHEAEVTAQLHHPHIVPVYDLFVPVARDKAFYTMPFLEGRSLADAVRASHQAGTPPQAQRGLLTAFVAVGQAVAYAHRRGVLHRDLKGQNIMLGGPGEVFVVDWGLAKVLGQGDDPTQRPLQRPAADDELLTRQGTRKGTPGFMAPEQAAGRVDLVDQRSDVYGLGAVLYEILTGKPPVELSPEETRKLLGAETRPAELSPAQALQLGEELLRKVEAGEVVPPSRRCPQVPKALEAICLKALAREREQRYASATDVADDVARWLADEPVAVYRDPLPVRLARLVRRHRTLAGAVALVLLTALLGLGVGLWAVDRERAETARERDQKEQARQAAEQAAAAERQAKVAAEAAGKLARDRLGYVENVNRILTSVFRDLNPRLEEQGGPPLLAQLAERLDKAAALLESEAIGDPLTVARLQSDLAGSLTNLGFPARAVELAAGAARTLEVKLGAEHADTLLALSRLAMAYHAAGRPDQALPLCEETLRKRKATLGEDDPDTLTSMNNLALVCQAAGLFDRGLRLYQETLDRTRAKLGADHPHTLTAMSNLGVAYQQAGRLDQAVPLLQATADKRQKVLGPDHADTLTSWNNLAVAYWAAGRLDRAAPLFDETLAKRKAKLGPDHPATLLSMHNLASAYLAAGRLDKALPLFEETLAKRQGKLGADHPDTLASMSKLAVAYRADGQLDRAVALQEKTLAGRQARLGADHPDTLVTMNDLAVAYRAAGRLDKALPLFQAAFAGMKTKLGPEHPDTLEVMNSLGGAYRAAGQLDRAVPLLEETLAKRQGKWGPDHPKTLITMNDLALTYKTARLLDQAVALYEATWERMKAKLGPEHPNTITTMHNLAAAYNALGRLDLALPLYRETLHKRKARLGPNHPETLSTLNNLALALEQVRRYGEAETLLEEWIARQRGKLPANDLLLADRLYLLGKARVLLQRFAEAEAPLRDSLALYLKKRPNGLARYQAAGVLGAALAGQKKHAEAEPLLVGAARYLLANAPSDRAALRGALEQVIDLYEAWDRPGDAAVWRKELEALREP
jgi:serine/threonine protein kinase/lipopolysaccharide biosynthesis regulator YciM